MDISDDNLHRAEYLCPGETQAISWSLHLARLAAGFRACQHCKHRWETGTLPKEVVAGIERKLNQGWRGTQHEYWSAQSPQLRGVSLNEMTRPVIMQVVEHALEHDRAFGAREESSLGDKTLNSTRQNAHINFENSLEVMHERDGPRASFASNRRRCILIAHDWRPSSPELAVGIVSVVRRWGCEIVDLGQVNRSCFDYAMSQFPADLGFFVTGGVEPEKVNGCDIVDSNGIEWSHPGTLTRLRERLEQPANRDCRQAGDFQSVAVTQMYQSHIMQQFQGIHSLKVAVACGEPLTLQTLGGALLEHGCEVQFIELNFADPDLGQQSARFRQLVRDSHVDVGFLIRSDGQSIFVFDERGQQLSLARLVTLLNPQWDAIGYLGELDPSMIGTPYHSVEEMLKHRKRETTGLVTDRAGRFWFHDSLPACDALHVVSRVLKVIQTSKWPLSGLGKRATNSNSPSGL